MVEVFNRVLGHGEDIVMLTDQELCFLINDELEADEQISFRTFQRYKAMALLYDEGSTDLEAEVDGPAAEPVNVEVYRQLHQCWMRNRIKQKRTLIQKMTDKVDGWHRYKWLLQRKFPEFSDKHIEVNGVPLDQLLEYKETKAPDFPYTAGRVVEVFYDPSLPGGRRYFQRDKENDITYELPHYENNSYCGCRKSTTYNEDATQLPHYADSPYAKNPDLVKPHPYDKPPTTPPRYSPNDGTQERKPWHDGP